MKIYAMLVSFSLKFLHKFTLYDEDFHSFTKRKSAF